MRPLGTLVREFVLAGYRSPGPVAVTAVLFLLASPWIIGGLRIDTDLSRLLGRDDAVSRAYEANRRAFGETNPLLVAIDCAGAPAQACDLVADGASTAIRAWPDVRTVERPDRPSADVLALALRTALIAGGPARVEAFAKLVTPDGMRAALLQTRRILVLADDPDTRERLASDVLGVGRLLADAVDGVPGVGVLDPARPRPPGSEHQRLIVVRPAGPAEDAAYCAGLTTRLDAVLDAQKRAHPGAGTVGHAYAGVHAITAESAATLNRELLGITVSAGLMALGLLWLAFRRIGPVLLCAIPLALSTAGALALARVVFNPINFLAVGFAGIVVGLGVDVGIHLTYRLLATSPALSGEERVRQALARCVRPVLAAATTTVVAFGSLVAARNAGVVQLGLLAGAGLAVSVAITLLVFPALARLVGPLDAPHPATASLAAYAARPGQWAAARPVRTMVIGAAAVATALAAVGRLEIDRDVYRLVPDRIGARLAGVDAASRLGLGAGPGLQVTVSGRTFDKAVQAQHALDRRLAGLAQAGLVAAVVSPSALLPAPDQFVEVRHRLDAAFARLAGRHAHFLAALQESGFRADARYTHYFDVLQRAADTRGLTAAGRPSDGAGARHLDLIAASLDGHARLLTTVWPAVGVDQPGPAQVAAASDLATQITAPGLPEDAAVEVTSALQVYSRLNDLLLEDLARVTGIGLALAGAVTLWHVRSAAASLLAVMPLAAALAVSLGLVSAAGVPLAPVTAMFGAIVIGIGLDSSFHVLAHAGRASGWEPEKAMREAGLPIVLSTLTTAIGFGALATSSLPAVSSLGIVVAVTTVCCGAGALTLLPAALALLRRARGGSYAWLVGTVLCLAVPPTIALAQAESPATRILDRLQQRYETADALSCRFEQRKTIAQLAAPVRVRGTAVFQRPMFLKLELTGDESVAVHADNRRVWIVDPKTGNYEEIELADLAKHPRWLRTIPTTFLGDFADLRARFTARLAPGAGTGTLVLTAQQDDETCREITLEVDALDRPRRVLMRFANGDEVETRFEAWSRLPRLSEAWFRYRPTGKDLQ